MKIENLERASQINAELAKLRMAQSTLANGALYGFTAVPVPAQAAWSLMSLISMMR